MENNRRPNRAAVAPQRRLIRYGRSGQVLPKPQSSASPEVALLPDATQPHQALATPNVAFTLRVPKLKLSKLQGAEIVSDIKAAWLHFNTTRVGKWFADFRVRALFIMLLVVMLADIILPSFQTQLSQKNYNLGTAGSLLSPVSQTVASKLKLNNKQQTYDYNASYTPPTGSQLSSQGLQITATAGQDPAKGVSVTDPLNQVSLTLTPKYRLWQGKQDGSRVIYPLSDGAGWAVYTMHTIGVKEDILLTHNAGDTRSFAYDLGLGGNYAAKVLANGSVGIYGNTVLAGSVATGSAKDAALLQKARQKADKTTLLFLIPAPTVSEAGRATSVVKAKYVLRGNTLSIDVSNLSKAHYPLAIDPSVYVETAQKFMRGNNESNISFDVADDLIQKGKTTGARINAWSSTSNLATPVWGQGTAVAGGFIYTVGGSGGTTPTTVTYYSAGSTTFNVPAGVTTVSVKVWGAGGGGGTGSGAAGKGGDGGGGGYAKADITVTPLEALSVLVGTGGGGGTTSNDGGDGGGYSALKRSSTFLVQAGGGGGGGGARGIGSGAGGAGGAGGGASGIAGAAKNGGGGNAGTNSAGGTGGSAGGSGAAGATGAANAGGDAGGSGAACATSVSGASGGAGGTGAGGSGGTAGTCEGGGGGGGGRFGGGGGGSVNANNSGAGGGGGGSDLVTGSNTVETAGSGITQGNSGDSTNNGAGAGSTGVSATSGGGTGTAGGIVISYTTGSSTPTSTVSWAKFDPTTNQIVSPDPGAGACSGWCTNSVYNLPAALTNMQVIAYNGFLYALGGENSSGTPQTTVYIAKLGANGEPQLWHPTGGTPTYWYTDTALPAARSRFAAVAYNNKLYILGGLTTSSTLLSSNTVQAANVTPTGQLSTFSSTGMQALSASRYGLSAQQYNGVIYVMGGDATFTGTPITTVEYSKLNSDGTMNTWVSTNTLTSARMAVGGNYAAIWGGYIYVAGGCSAVNGSGYCTTIATDVQLASINADGSLDTWNSIIGLTNDRIGGTMIAWQNGLYRIGGCRAVDSSSGVCTDTILDADYGVINQDGDASTVSQSVASGTAPCSGASPTNCNLPPTSNIGQALNATAVMNGYLYVIGGCTTTACSAMSTNVVYSAISTNGALTKPTTCTSATYSGTWCIDSTNTITGGVGAAAVAIFNSRIYVVGGLTGAGNKNTINYTTVNADGTIAAWTSTSLTGAGGTSVSYEYAYARANPTSTTLPGNLYIFGGCSTSSAAGCTAYSDAVYKCTIATAGTVASCSKTSQLQIGIVPGDSSAGLGIMAGTVYANYIYLVGGVSPNQTDLKTTRYAKFDNSNNVVTVGTGWTEATNQMSVGRRRAAAFGYNGYIYVVGGYDGTGGGGILADIEFVKINVSDGSLGTATDGFHVSSVTIGARWGLSVPVSNSYAYVIGGCDTGASPTCSSMTATVQTFQVYNNDSGTAAGYAATGSCGAGSNGPCATNGIDRIGAAATVMNGYMYLAGGCTTASCTVLTGAVSYAPIDANGVVGAWAAGNALPGGAARTYGKLVGVGGTLYYVGGQSGTANTTAQSDVFFTTSFSSGNPTWNATKATCGVSSTGCVGNPRTQFGIAVWNDRIYVVGGYNPTGTLQKKVYISPRLTSGGDITSSWNDTSTALPIARAGLMATAYANNLYVFGGNDGTNFLNDSEYTSIGTSSAGTITQTASTTVTGSGTSFNNGQVGSTLVYPDTTTATITAVASTTSMTVSVSKTVSAGTTYVIQDGSTGSWTYTTSLPTNVSDGDAFAANGYMYIIGGRTAATTCDPVTLVSPISANTSIASGNSPTGIGEWYQTNVNYTGGRYGAAATYSKGRAYIMGGGCNSAFVSSADRNYATAVLSQPQTAQYSIMIDADTDVFPSKWLFNGLDNSVGAHWQLNYQSMKNTTTLCNGAAMTTWGQVTNVGDITLGTPGTYTAKDGSGTNTNCARFFYLNISIDASQTFGYPEDISRGPTISDMTLQFTSDPSKRLMHGRTFLGGLQQPDDTPF